MQNSQPTSYKSAYPLACILILSGMFGLFSGCGGKPGPKEPLPQAVDGCEYQILMGPFPTTVLHCDEAHALGAVRSDARVEIRVSETAKVTHLDLGGFRNLLALRIDNSNIKTLDLSSNSTLADVQLNMPGLVDLRLPATEINSVALRNMPELTELDSSGTQFQILKLSGELGFDEASLLAHTEIRDLELGRLELAELDLTPFKNLQSLSISDCEFMNLTLPAQPIDLWISEGSIKELDLSSGTVRRVVLNSTAIQWLKLADQDFGSVQVTNHKAATLKITGGESVPVLEITDGEIEALDVDDFSSLQKLSLSGGKIGHLNLQENKNLTQLSVLDSLATTQITLPPDAPITEINLQNISLSDLDMPGYRTLIRLDIQYVPLTQLTMEILNGLHELSLAGTLLSEISLSAMPNLVTLEIREHELSGLDLSSNHNVTTLSLLDVHGFTELDLSHLGLVDLSILGSDLSCESLQKIADQFSGLGESGNLYLADLGSC